MVFENDYWNKWITLLHTWPLDSKTHFVEMLMFAIMMISLYMHHDVIVCSVTSIHRYKNRSLWLSIPLSFLYNTIDYLCLYGPCRLRSHNANIQVWLVNLISILWQRPGDSRYAKKIVCMTKHDILIPLYYVIKHVPCWPSWRLGPVSKSVSRLLPFRPLTLVVVFILSILLSGHQQLSQWRGRINMSLSPLLKAFTYPFQFR